MRKTKFSPKSSKTKAYCVKQTDNSQEIPFCYNTSNFKGITFQVYFWSKPRAAAIMPNFLRITDFFLQLCESIFLKALDVPQVWWVFLKEPLELFQKNITSIGGSKAETSKNLPKMTEKWKKNVILGNDI